MITILQIEDRNDDFLIKLMNENKKICNQNNYNYIRMTKSSEHIPPYWGKVFEIKHIMNKSGDNSYIMWLDSDAFIVNPKNLEKIITENPQYSMFITGDMPPYISSFNAGSFIIKNNKIGREIIDKWIKCYKPDYWKFDNGKWITDKFWAGEAYEQGSFIKYVLPLYKYKNEIKIMKYYTLNNNDCKHLHKDTISVHLAGIFKKMKKYQCTQLIDNKHIDDKYIDYKSIVLLIVLIAILVFIFNYFSNKM